MTPQINLSEQQKKIVEYDEHNALYIEADAGTGKTRVLTERIRYLLNKTKKKILALTFTNKAGKEIKERLSDVPDLEKRVFIGTFHSFCQYMLENHGSLIGLTKMPHIFENEADRLELVEQAINQTPSYVTWYKNQKKEVQRSTCYRLLNFISQVKRKLIATCDLQQHTDDENLVLVYQNYQDILHAQNAIDFDELLLLAHSLLLNYPQIAGLYRRSFFGICIDEAQDLNNAQYKLLVALANGDFTQIMIVGSPIQSVYHFNGSSSQYMEKYFHRDFKPVTTLKLTENYRSSKAILSAAHKIFPQEIVGTVKEGIFEKQALQDEKNEAKWVIDKINSLMNAEKQEYPDIEGDIHYEKIAVLARNKYLFKILAAQLEENKLPFYYKMTAGSMLFESDLMKSFDLALKIRINPHDRLHKHRLCQCLKIKSVENGGLDMLIPHIRNELYKNIITLVAHLNDDGRNIKGTLEDFRKHLKIEDENEKNMIFNDIEELLKHWHNYARKTDHKSLHQFKNAMALGQTHPLAQQKGITLSTIHSAKGLEFDIVFIIGLDDETFPDYRAVRKGGIELTQEKNNLYVAFTRAKRFLYVTWPQKRMMPWGDYKKRIISRFLKDF